MSPSGLISDLRLVDCVSSKDGFVVVVSSYIAMSVALRFAFGSLKVNSEIVSYA